jgi:hypothetical protein
MKRTLLIVLLFGVVASVRADNRLALLTNPEVLNRPHFCLFICAFCGSSIRTTMARSCEYVREHWITERAGCLEYWVGVWTEARDGS